MVRHASPALRARPSRLRLAGHADRPISARCGYHLRAINLPKRVFHFVYWYSSSGAGDAICAGFRYLAAADQRPRRATHGEARRREGVRRLNHLDGVELTVVGRLVLSSPHSASPARWRPAEDRCT